MRRPPQYRAPIRSRALIVEWLTRNVSLYFSRDLSRRYGRCAPSWNVRVYRYDETGMRYAEEFKLRDELTDRWTAHFAAHPEIMDWVIEAAGGLIRENMWTDWDSRTGFKFEFHGRSGGNLLLVDVPNHKTIFEDEDDFERWLRELPISDLRRFYGWIVQMNHDFRREAVDNEVTHEIAFQRSQWEDEVAAGWHDEARAIEASRPDMYPEKHP